MLLTYILLGKEGKYNKEEKQFKYLTFKKL